MIPTLRRATAADLPAIATADSRAFGVHYTDADLDGIRAQLDPARFLLALDGERVVGVAGSFPFTVTLPGGGALPVEGVTWVSVAPTHRRRGVLRALMAEQHRDFVAGGLAVSMLTASEGGIYGRFGYGPATVSRGVEIDRRFAVFRADVPDPGGVRFVDADEARALAPGVQRRWCAVTPGALSRDDLWWDGLLRDPEHRRGGRTALFHLMHPDGYASYRIDHSDASCHVVDLFAATGEAHLALWRVLLGLDLARTVRAPRACPPGDPLPFLLTDPRQVRTTGLRDGTWARVLDVAAVLAARRYTVEVDVVLEVRDTFLDRGGRFRLRGGPDGAECTPAVGAPAVHVDVTALGSLLLGGHRASTLGRAHLLRTGDPALLRRLDAAFTADRDPVHGTEF
ncbi:MAG TPA: GNAT family N-acetyltransferase [Pseudonocardia sp.]|nr:GNAT family N-acetyltransferase [Pseudonocardia sp.]